MKNTIKFYQQETKAAFIVMQELTERLDSLNRRTKEGFPVNKNESDKIIYIANCLELELIKKNIESLREAIEEQVFDY